MALDSIYKDSSYAADNDARMAFYLQLPLIVQGQTIAKNNVLINDGFDIFTVVYECARFMNYFASSNTVWKANRAKIGFGLFNLTCATTDPCYSVYGSSTSRKVNAMPGNDFLLVALTFITGKSKLWCEFG